MERVGLSEEVGEDGAEGQEGVCEEIGGGLKFLSWEAEISE